MIKKVVLGTLLVGLIGILVAGAIIRTVDKTENVAEARGLDHSQGQGIAEGHEAEERGQGQGRGYGQSATGPERQYPNLEAAPEDWTLVEGTVTQPPGDGVDLLLETDAGKEIVVGTGPGYMEAQGFTLQAGERVEVQGYWEDDELKAAQVTRLQDGQSITLRDQSGRPAWAGSGKRAVERQADGVQDGQGQGALSGQGQGQGQGGSGQGQGGSGQGRGGQGTQEGTGGTSGGAGTGQAQASSWQTLYGTVASVDVYTLIVHTTEGQEVIVEGQPWRFAQELGFSAQPDDQVTLVGFDEDGEFKIGQIHNTTTGNMVLIREENGRPLWAGRGRGGK